jgi:predicted nucleotidyltransferase
LSALFWAQWGHGRNGVRHLCAHFFFDLQDLLGQPVDLVTDKGLMAFARPSVDRDKILIYERVA